MKKNEIKVGMLYVAKVGDRVVTVRIDGVSSHGGWNATNTATGKPIRIKSAQRLRSAAKGATKAARIEASEENADSAATEEKTNSKKKAAREQKPKRSSALDAAAQVLAKADKPMAAQELITAMAEKGLWKSPGGKTPASTLYAAMIREISTKGKNARFQKVERGMFAING